MKTKDPRKLLSLFFRISMAVLILSFYLGVSVQTKNFTRFWDLLIKLAIALAIVLLTWIFYPAKKIEATEQGLHNIIMMGYMFGTVWLFFGIVLTFGISSDYFKGGHPFPYGGLIAMGLLLFFGIGLIYLANKSRKYEKDKKGNELDRKSIFILVFIFMGISFIFLNAYLLTNVEEEKIPIPFTPNNWYCEKDDDCIKVNAECCGCNSGGTAAAISKIYYENWTKRMEMGCKRTECNILLNLDSQQDWSCSAIPKCVNNSCNYYKVNN